MIIARAPRLDPRRAEGCKARGYKGILHRGLYTFFSLLVLEGVIIDSRTESRSRISLLLVNKFSLLTTG
jgi:hypothetical protein